MHLPGKSQGLVACILWLPCPGNMKAAIAHSRNMSISQACGAGSGTTGAATGKLNVHAVTVGVVITANRNRDHPR